MSKTDEFRQYAEEALRGASQSKIEKEKKALIDLARTWTLAALSAESPLAPSGDPAKFPEARAPTRSA